MLDSCSLSKGISGKENCIFQDQSTNILHYLNKPGDSIHRDEGRLVFDFGSNMCSPECKVKLEQLRGSAMLYQSEITMDKLVSYPGLRDESHIAICPILLH